MTGNKKVHLIGLIVWCAVVTMTITLDIAAGDTDKTLSYILGLLAGLFAMHFATRVFDE